MTRALWRRLPVLADQAASSLSNILVFVLVARSAETADAVGAFGLAMIAYQLILGAARAVVGEPLLSLYSSAEPETRRRLLADLHGMVLFLGVLGSLALWLGAVWTGGLSGSALLALALVLPFVLVQDAWRFVLVVDRPVAALLVDIVWLVAVVVMLPLAPADAGPAWYVVAWGLGGAVSAVVGTAVGRGLPLRLHPWRWVVEHRAFSLRFLGEYVTARAVSQVTVVALGGVQGLGALGAFKASDVYYGPLNTLHSGLYLAVVPEGVRLRDDPRRLRTLIGLVSAALAAVAAAWMVVGLLLPDDVGRSWLGPTWGQVEDIMLPMGLAAIAGGVASGGLVGLRSLGDARRSFGARLYTAPWQAVCPVVGVMAGGLMGFAVGLLVARAVSALIWWYAFGAALRDVASGGDLPAPTSVEDADASNEMVRLEVAG